MTNDYNDKSTSPSTAKPIQPVLSSGSRKPFPKPLGKDGKNTEPVSGGMGKPSATQEGLVLINTPLSSARVLPSPRLERPTTGSKTISEEYYRAMLEDSDVSDAETHSDMDIDDREGSPVTEADGCYWEYQVKRKIWSSYALSEEIPWDRCGAIPSYLNLREANLVAEYTAERLRQELGADFKGWHLLFDHDMAEYSGLHSEGFFKVIVDRSLCVPHEKRLPTSKQGWLKKKVYDLKCRCLGRDSAARQDDTLDAIFAEPMQRPEEQDVEFLKEQDHTDGALYTILDQANRAAMDLVLDLTTKNKHQSKRIEDVIRRAEAMQRLRSKIDDLERADETFRESCTAENGMKYEVWVQERNLVGPRNI